MLINFFLDSVRKYPNKPALNCQGMEFTYLELFQQASKIENHLRNDQSKIVGILFDRSPQAYIGILGVLMSGKGYVPLNPKFPQSRTLYMVDLANLNTILYCSKLEHLIKKAYMSGQNNNIQLINNMDTPHNLDEYIQNEIEQIFKQQENKQTNTENWYGC